MTADECRNELVMMRRRDMLSSSQRVALEQHQRECSSCRLTRDFSDAFDEVESIPPDDINRLNAMLDAASRWIDQPRSLTRIADRKRSIRIAMLVAALSVVTTAAAASLVVRSQFWKFPNQAAIGAIASPDSGKESGSMAPPVTETADTAKTTAIEVRGTVAAVAAATPTVLAAPTVGQSRGHATVVARAVEESPSLLLQRATDARRASNPSEASRLFQRLQQRYPSSRESQLSEVVYGSMLLEQGQAGPALMQFQRYLSASGGRNLSAEALYGKGRALAQLGRGAEEQATWRTLLDQFPKSPYVSHAQKRLSLLK